MMLNLFSLFFVLFMIPTSFIYSQAQTDYYYADDAYASPYAQMMGEQYYAGEDYYQYYEEGSTPPAAGTATPNNNNTPTAPRPTGVPRTPPVPAPSEVMYSSLTNTNQNLSAEEFLKLVEQRAPHKTLALEQLKTKKVPILFSSDGMLKNINETFWTLKFYGLPNNALYKAVKLNFENCSVNIKVIDYDDRILDNNTFYLTPILMYKPNEGVFAYTDKSENIFFVYLYLLLPNLLAMDMQATFEEAQQAHKKPLVDLGVFVLE